MEVNEEFEVCPDNPYVKVSKNGNVRNAKTDEILDKKIDKDRYYIVDDPSKKRKFEFVHKLVALTYLKKNKDFKSGRGFVVHHIDHDSFNNNVDNLAWMNCCVHADVFHGTPANCRECTEYECEYRRYLDPQA